MTPPAICEVLKQGDPSVRVRLEDDLIQVAAQSLKDGEDEIVAERLRQILAR